MCAYFWILHWNLIAIRLNRSMVKSITQHFINSKIKIKQFFLYIAKPISSNSKAIKFAISVEWLKTWNPNADLMSNGFTFIHSNKNLQLNHVHECVSISHCMKLNHRFSFSWIWKFSYWNTDSLAIFNSFLFSNCSMSTTVRFSIVK